jgi:steroid 5-alpha reductase family enzyme
MFLVAVVNAPTAAAALGPLLLTGFLLKWSGVGHQERSLKKTKPSYADYIARTNAFVPGRRSSLRLGSRR